MLSFSSLPISTRTYSKYPFSSELGERIIVEGIRLMKAIGHEAFTFRKLAHVIDSTEASVYRYFPNKHLFLVFLSNLYWNWLEQRVRQLSHEDLSHQARLEKAIDIIVTPVIKKHDQNFPFNDLIEVIISEGPKVYLTKFVDQENKEGVFMAYKSLCEAISQLILNINPKYRYGHSLATTIIESAHDQLFFSRHLPRLTDIGASNFKQLNSFIVHTVTSALEKNENDN